MTEHFNKLTPAEAERLTMLAEEAGEIVQAVGKILRHGYRSRHPDDLQGPDNRAMLEKELADILAVARAMIGAADILDGWLYESRSVNVWQKKRRYTHHQEPKS